jgi:hypothetical protein
MSLKKKKKSGYIFNPVNNAHCSMWMKQGIHTINDGSVMKENALCLHNEPLNLLHSINEADGWAEHIVCIRKNRIASCCYFHIMYKNKYGELPLWCICYLEKERYAEMQN